MSDEQNRAEERERVLLLATLRLHGKELTVKVRNISAGGALIEGLEGAIVGQAAEIGIRDHGWVSCRVAWTAGGRTGLSFTTRLALKPQPQSSEAHFPQDGSAIATSIEPTDTSAVRDFYVVKWVKGTQVLSQERFEDLLVAKTHATSRLPLQRIRKGVTAVHVCDVDGVTYFKF